jgi:hypothetical protein
MLDRVPGPAELTGRARVPRRSRHLGTEIDCATREFLRVRTRCRSCVIVNDALYS